MVKSGTERSKKYDAKFDADVVRSRFAATATIAKEGQAAMQQLLADKSAAVRQILDSDGIFPVLSVLYISFSNKLFAICNKFSGLTAYNSAVLEAVKWGKMGATSPIMAEIWNLYSDTLGAAPSPFVIG